MYHYVEDGLLNIYLENGYELVDTQYGKGLTIDNFGGLHIALDAAIGDSPHPSTIVAALQHGAWTTNTELASV